MLFSEESSFNTSFHINLNFKRLPFLFCNNSGPWNTGHKGILDHYNEFEEVKKIYIASFKCTILKSLLNSICYARK